jgi:hypothetical protein
MTEKKDDNWGKLSLEAQQNCIKAVVRLFVLAGSRKEAVSRSKVKLRVFPFYTCFPIPQHVAIPGAGHVGEDRQRLQEAGGQGAHRGTL